MTWGGNRTACPVGILTVRLSGQRVQLLYAAAMVEQLSPAVRERSDAARNRARVLAAAEELFASHDPRDLTMGDIAGAAGVGRATLYRRFPDIASIARALLDEHERQLQEQLLYGPPPLGPGAAPGDRLAAFYAALVGLLERHLNLILGAESGSARLQVGAYGFWRAHVHALLREADVSHREQLVDMLLAPLDPEVYRFQRQRGSSERQIAAALGLLGRRVLSG